MKVLVTGGAGFIGSHLTARLVREGHEVRVLDNFATGRRRSVLHLADEIELIEGDIQSYERAANAARGCDLVFHQAALPSIPRSVQDPLTSNATNVIGTLNVLLAARDAGARRVIYASSSSIYGKNRALPKQEDQIPLPISPYAVAKLAGEGYCRSFSEVYGLETVSLRYFNVFGPRQDPLSPYAAVIPRFISAFLDSRRPTVFGDGEQSRDFTYVENVVDANLLAASSSGGVGETFNIACGERITLNRLVEQVAEELESDVAPAFEAPRPGEIRDSVADVSRAREVLGYQPRVSFREGLGLTIPSHLEARRRAPTEAP